MDKLRPCRAADGTTPPVADVIASLCTSAGVPTSDDIVVAAAVQAAARDRAEDETHRVLWAALKTTGPRAANRLVFHGAALPSPAVAAIRELTGATADQVDKVHAAPSVHCCRL